MSAYYRVFFKKKEDPPSAPSTGNEEFSAMSFMGAVNKGNKLAKKRKERLVMVAEITGLSKK